jgi:hypothetical protein
MVPISQLYNYVFLCMFMRRDLEWGVLSVIV